jgi:hypothetical protein
MAPTLRVSQLTVSPTLQQARMQTQAPTRRLRAVAEPVALSVLVEPVLAVRLAAVQVVQVVQGDHRHRRRLRAVGEPVALSVLVEPVLAVRLAAVQAVQGDHRHRRRLRAVGEPVALSVLVEPVLAVRPTAVQVVQGDPRHRPFVATTSRMATRVTWTAVAAVVGAPLAFIAESTRTVCP